MKRITVSVVRVFRAPTCPSRGRLRAGPLDLPCALGSAGPTAAKREGDGATPRATMRVIGAYYRADRLRRPRTLLPMRALRPDDGWCDDPTSRSYNRPVRLPAASSHERMWRDDGLYDLVLDLAWNRRPAIKGRGSAIFLHAARTDLGPTHGCIAVPRRTLARLAERLGPRTLIAVGGAKPGGRRAHPLDRSAGRSDARRRR